MKVKNQQFGESDIYLKIEIYLLLKVAMVESIYINIHIHLKDKFRMEKENQKELLEN
jgi:hypothetical protein